MVAAQVFGNDYAFAFAGSQGNFQLKISLTAYREDISLREAALKLGFLTEQQFDLWVRPQDMTHPLGGRL